MINVSIQFNCDAPECRKTRLVPGTPEQAKAIMDSFFELGWEKRGRKVFCPICAGNNLEDSERHLLH